MRSRGTQLSEEGEVVDRTSAHNTAQASGSFSLIAGSPEYLAFVTGNDASELGGYDFMVEVATAGDFTCSERVFLGGAVTFDGTISDTNSCLGTIAFGPFTGDPLIFQGRYATLEEGKECTVSLTGLGAGDGAVALFLYRSLGSGVDPFTLLDLADHGGDPDRSFTFVAPTTGDYYLEVSDAPGEVADYTFSLCGPG